MEKNIIFAPCKDMRVGAMPAGIPTFIFKQAKYQRRQHSTKRSRFAMKRATLFAKKNGVKTSELNSEFQKLFGGFRQGWSGIEVLTPSPPGRIVGS